MTVALTQAQQQPTEVLRLHRVVEAPLAERLNRFLDTLQASPLIDGEILAAWRKDFEREFLHIVVGENEDVSLALCMLLCSIIDPAIDATDKDSPEEAHLLAFEKTLRTLLEKLVPRGESVDQFIASYETFLDQRARMYEQLEAIEKIFQEKMKELCGSANAYNEELQAKYQNLKARLRQINQMQMHEMIKIRAELEGEAALVNGLTEAFDQLTCHLQGLDTRLESVRVALIQASEQCKQSLMRIKRS